MEDNTNLNSNTNEQEQGNKTYTEEELNARIQAEADRRVNQALKKREKEMSEAAKLAAMDEAEKRAYQLEQREKELAEKEKLIALNENKYEATKILADKGLPVAFADFVVTHDADTTKANIKVLEKAFNEAVAAKVKATVGIAPAVGGTQQPLTKAAFGKMSLNEQNQLFKENPDLYRQMTD